MNRSALTGMLAGLVLAADLEQHERLPREQRKAIGKKTDRKRRARRRMQKAGRRAARGRR